MATLITAFSIIFLLAGIGIGWSVRSLIHRIEVLESGQAKHLPYRTADGIENAEAAMLYGIEDIKVKKILTDQEYDELERRFVKALSYLQEARSPKGK